MRYRARYNALALCVFVMFIVTCKYLVLQDTQQQPKTTPSTPSQVGTVVPFRHVTKSLSELGKMDEISAHVLFLNCVPKSGSEILVVLLKWLQGWNVFRHVRLKGKKRRLDDSEQEELVYGAYDSIRNEAVPVSFDRDVYFVNFTKFDRQSPTYINLIRDPADYLISRFHHLLYMSGNFKSTKLRTTSNIESCIMKKEKQCLIESGKSYDLAIPYFCGQETRCGVLNDKWALDKAKGNVEKYFAVVGILEEVNTTLEVFEQRLPYFFKGVQNLYYRDLLQPFHRNRAKLPKASETFRDYIKPTLEKEYEFYEFIRTRLFGQLQVIYGEHNH